MSELSIIEIITKTPQEIYEVLAKYSREDLITEIVACHAIMEKQAARHKQRYI